MAVMTYKDKTFCTASDCIKFDTCKDAMTAEVIMKARMLDMHISQCDMFPCYKGEE